MSRNDWLNRIFAAVVSAAAVLPAVSANADDYKIRIGVDLPGMPHGYIRVLKDYFLPEVAKRVEAETKFRIQYVYPFAEQGATPHAIVSALAENRLDIGAWCACTQEVPLLPFRFDSVVPFSSPDAAVQLAVKRRILAENPEVLLTLENRYQQKVLAFIAGGGEGLATRREWTRLEDLKGLAVIAPRSIAHWLDAAGIAPSASAPLVAVRALSNGVAWGIVIAPAVYVGLDAASAAPFYKRTDFGAPAENVLSMNSGFRLRLPYPIAKVIDEVAASYQTMANAEAGPDATGAIEAAVKAGAKVSDLALPERRAWAAAAQEGANLLANRMIADYGVDGFEIMSKYVKYMEEEGHTWPVRYVFKRIE